MSSDGPRQGEPASSVCLTGPGCLTSFSPSTLTRHPLQLHSPWPALAVQDPLTPGRASLHLLTGTPTWHEPHRLSQTLLPQAGVSAGLAFVYLYTSRAWSPVVDQKTILE